ncbi:MAG: ATP-binding protein [archaeon]
MYDIVIGRTEADKKAYGLKGAVFLGRHYVKMGMTTSLSSNVYLDMVRSHVVFVVGKRGSGKSYTMGVIAEGVADVPIEIKKNISVILLDTMGVYWTMKYPNQKDKQLLKEWGLDAKGLDIKIYTPGGYYDEYMKKGIPTDYPFSLQPSELEGSDWCSTFSLSTTEPVGVFVERIIQDMQDAGNPYTMQDIIKNISADDKEEQHVKQSALNLFQAAARWGIFSNKGTPLTDLVRGGQITVLDLSCYATVENSWNIKNLIVGLVAEKLFVQRMLARKDEEYEAIHKTVNYFGEEEKQESFPMVWLIIDEAHEFLPNQGKTLATEPLITILREGRQPGISLILATQQPGKIHTDVMTQADTVIAHRITAKIDTESLGALMQSYMREGLVQQLDDLPRISGAALIFDDNNEKLFPIAIRPRFTWHGGSAPTAIKETNF